MRLLLYIFIPIISGLIGWITNYIAVKMIFRPRYQKKILGIKFQGLIPMRQKELALKIGETIELELISHKDVADVIKSEDVKLSVMKLIEEQIDIFLKDKLSSHPMIGMFLQGDALVFVKSLLVNHILEVIPEMLDQVMLKVESKLDFKALARKKIEEFDLTKLENIVMSIANKELKSIEILGGILGFLVGLIQVLFLFISDMNIVKF